MSVLSFGSGQNLRIKRVGEPICNTSRYEFSVLSSLITKQKNDLTFSGALREGIIGKYRSMPGHPGVRVGKAVAAHGRRIHTSDIVFHGDEAGLVVGAAMENGSFYVTVRVLQPCLPTWRSSSTYIVSSDMRVLRVEGVVEASAWYQVDEDKFVVLR